MSNSIDKHRLIYITNCRGVVCVCVLVTLLLIMWVELTESFFFVGERSPLQTHR